VIAGRSTTGGGTITSFHSHIKDVGYDGVYSLPRHRAAQSMETGRDPAAMVVKAQKRPSLSSRTFGPARADIPPCPRKRHFKVSWVLLDSSRF